MVLIKLLFYSLLIVCIHCMRQCDENSYYIRYHKLKTCYKSTMTVIAWKNLPTVEQCKDFVRERNGLAFNYSPGSAVNYTKGYFKNCQVLGCPETSNDTLEMDIGFDYYTAYGNFSNYENALCLKSEGLFKLIQTPLNYTEAITYCQTIGGDLANILSESRTTQLANMLKNQLNNWYQAAYIGLDDILEEGLFQTAFGSFLSCSKYRAWAPGHPRSKRKKDDCVILDSERTWRVINCKHKLPSICELFPQKPNITTTKFKFENISCNKIKNKRKRKLCRNEKDLQSLLRNSSRVDQCAFEDY